MTLPDPNTVPSGQIVQPQGDVQMQNLVHQPQQQYSHTVPTMQYQQQTQVQQHQITFRHQNMVMPGQQMGGSGLTLLIYGILGTWKTSFAAQFPGVIFLSPMLEGGDDALSWVPYLYGVPLPPVIQIQTVAQFTEVVHQIVNQYERTGIKTVVIDSTTVLQRLWIYETLAKRWGDPKMAKKIAKQGAEEAYMVQRDWGLLAGWMNANMTLLHNTKLNVIWTCLAKTKYEKNSRGESYIVGFDPHLTGETREMLPAQCKMVMWAEKVVKTDMNNITHMYVQPVFHTSPTPMSKDWVRHKYGLAFPEGQLVDPEWGDVPTYRALYSRIGNFIYQ
jgi:hypothetical protein